MKRYVFNLVTKYKINAILFQHGLNEFNSLNESEIYMNIYFHLSLLKHAFKAKKTCTFSTLNITARGATFLA